MSKFIPDVTYHQSRLADRFGAACADAAEAEAAKDKIRAQIIDRVPVSAGTALFIGDAYDVTLSPSTRSKIDYEGILAKLVAAYGIKPAVLDSLRRRFTVETSCTSVRAKARVAREEVVA